MSVNIKYLELLEKILKEASSLYVLDLSWHLYRSHYTFKDMGINIDGYIRPTGHLYGVCSTIRMIKQVDENAVIIITQDGVPKERIEALASEDITYKEGRRELEFDFYKDIPIVKGALCSLPNVYWAYNEDKECDDLMYALVRQACQIPSFTGKCYVYSGDNDLLQAINDRTSVIRNKAKVGFDEITNETIMTDEKFTKKFHGVDSEHITYFRAICGDPSDRIKGIPRFPRDLAVKIAMSTLDFPRHSYEPVTEAEKRWCERYNENIDIVVRNYKLMKLSEDFQVNLTKPKVNAEKLEELLTRLQLNSFIKYLRDNNILNKED